MEPLITFKDWLNESDQAKTDRITNLRDNHRDFFIQAGKNKRLARQNSSYKSNRVRSNRKYRLTANPLRSIRAAMREPFKQFKQSKLGV